MSMTIYMPYFYIIQHINSGKYYAGVKFAKNSNPDNLLRPGGYQTSSSIVKQLITEDGLDSFTIRKIKIFETANKALNYESKFLKRVNAAFNDKFLNRSNNSTRAFSVDYDKSKQTCLKRFGYEYALQSEQVKERGRKTSLEIYGFEYPNQSPELKEKYKRTCLEKYGVENAFQSEEIKEKIRQTCLEKFGVENASQSPEIKEKIRQTCLERYGVEHHNQSPELKEKHKQTCLKKYGCENPSQSPEIKERKKATLAASMKRPTVLEIMKYKEKFNLKLIPRWFYKKQEVLDDIFLELKATYGELI